jgi:hypothetical protein
LAVDACEDAAAPALLQIVLLDLVLFQAGPAGIAGEENHDDLKFHSTLKMQVFVIKL